MTSTANGFDMSSVLVEGRRHTVARFTCVECAETLDIKVDSGMPMNAQAWAKSAGNKGWLAHPDRKNRTYCPKCRGSSSKPKNNPDSELQKVIPMVAATPIKPSPSIVSVVREITSDERVAIRSHLDKHFDDGVGAYLDGMSDQRIAETVGVPRAAVERLREAAYGPIKVDPVVAALREKIAAFRLEVDAQQRVLDALKVKALELGSSLEQRLARSA